MGIGYSTRGGNFLDNGFMKGVATTLNRHKNFSYICNVVGWDYTNYNKITFKASSTSGKIRFMVFYYDNATFSSSQLNILSSKNSSGLSAGTTVSTISTTSFPGVRFPIVGSHSGTILKTTDSTGSNWNEDILIKVFEFDYSGLNSDRFIEIEFHPNVISGTPQSDIPFNTLVIDYTGNSFDSIGYTADGIRYNDYNKIQSAISYIRPKSFALSLYRYNTSGERVVTGKLQTDDELTAKFGGATSNDIQAKLKLSSLDVDSDKTNISILLGQTVSDFGSILNTKTADSSDNFKYSGNLEYSSETVNSIGVEYSGVSNIARNTYFFSFFEASGSFLGGLSYTEKPGEVLSITLDATQDFELFGTEMLNSLNTKSSGDPINPWFLTRLFQLWDGQWGEDLCPCLYVNSSNFYSFISLYQNYFYFQPERRTIYNPRTIFNDIQFSKDNMRLFFKGTDLNELKFL